MIALSGTIAMLSLGSGIAAARINFSRPPGTRVVFIHLVDRAGIAPGPLRAAEEAVTAQVDTELVRVWDVPRLAFGLHGWRVTVEPQGRVHDQDGMHGVDARGRPYALVAHSYDWTIALSHEVLELLTDPYVDRRLYGQRVEICDPVGATYYVIGRVPVSDFVTPAWFRTPPEKQAHLSFIASL